MTSNLGNDPIEVRNELRKTEAAFDEALIQSSRLMQRVVQARQNPALNPNAGQSAIIRLSRAQQQVIDGSSDVFRVHAELSKVARELGIRDEPGTTVPIEEGLAESEPARAG
jgi:hypothetical protein